MNATDEPKRIEKLRTELVKRIETRLPSCVIYKRIFQGAMLSMALASTLACAAEEVYVIGLGQHGCGRWIAAANKPVARAQYSGWVLGFFSGMNWGVQSTQARVSDAESAIAFVDQYCKNNPLHVIALAAAALVQESGGAKALHKWNR